MLSLSALMLSGRPSGTVTTLPDPGQVTIAAFSRDRTIFDSGAGIGQSAALVPLTGGGTAGETVEARAVSQDDGGATTTPWTPVATIDAGGTWSGSITVPRGASWYRPEVRLAAAPSVAALGTNRFGVGHVIAIWGQSEPERIVSTFWDNTTPPAITDDEAVQVITGATATPVSRMITNAAPLTAAAAALADTLIRARPGEKFAVIFHSVAGTDPRELVNDANPGRSWAADKALHDFATADGQQVGLAAMSWFAAPGSLGDAYGAAMFPLFAGRLIDGTPVSFPATITYPGGSFPADHWFGELYDYAHTRWVPYGPHRFEIDADMRDATHVLGGAQQVNLANKQRARQSWRAMLTLPAASMFLPLGLEPVAYVNGLPDGAGGWTDFAHPAGNTADGTQAFARLTALAILQSAGLVPGPVPEFDQAFWEPSGAQVEVWSSAGPITTTRLARGEPPLPATFPHRTEVMGWQVNGEPAQNATIVAGRVRITPNGGGSFVAGDTIQYGEGGASGAIKFPEDLVEASWKNLPIVDPGIPGLDGVPLRPLADPVVLANTLPATSAFFSTAPGGPFFVDPLNVPAGTTAITYAARFRVPSLPGSTQILFAQTATGFDVELMNSGNLRVTVEDGTGAKMLATVVIQTGLAAGVWHDLVISANQTAAVLRVNLNGAPFATLPFTGTGNGVFQSNRALSLLARSGATLQFVGDVEFARIWLNATADGSAPAGTPYKSVTGPAALANADPWKQGANAI